MNFLHTVAVLTLGDRVRSSYIRKEHILKGGRSVFSCDSDAS